MGFAASPLGGRGFAALAPWARSLRLRVGRLRFARRWAGFAALARRPRGFAVRQELTDFVEAGL
jgi:hypothetical protein